MRRRDVHGSLIHMAGFSHLMINRTGAALLCCCAAVSAFAGPPGRVTPIGALGTHVNRLDLRLPSHDFGSYSARSVETPAAEPASKPLWGNRVSVVRMSAGATGDAGDTQSRPAASWTGGNSRPMGRIEAFARQVHREGLPLARLWENHSALVSLGLNPRGKPGLWLVQKTH